MTIYTNGYNVGDLKDFAEAVLAVQDWEYCPETETTTAYVGNFIVEKWSDDCYEVSGGEEDAW